MPAPRRPEVGDYALRARAVSSGTDILASNTTSSSESHSSTSSSSSTPPPTSTTSSTTTSSTSSSASLTSDLAASSSLSLESLASVASISGASILSTQSIQSTLSVESTASLASVRGTTSITTTASPTTVFVTNGLTITTTIAVPTTSGGANGSGGHHSSSNVGAIAGGVVGGVVGAFLIALLALFCWRRKKRSDFDGNFDPDRNIQRPATLPIINDLDLAAGPTTHPAPDGVDVSPRPFSVDGQSGSGFTGEEGYSPGSTGGAPSMSQYSGHGLLAGAGAVGAGAVAGGYTGQQVAQYYHPSNSNSNPSNQGHNQNYGAPSVVSSGSVYPASSEAYSPTSVSGGAGGVAGGRLGGAKMSKQQEAARAYAETHPDYSRQSLAAAAAGGGPEPEDPSVVNSSASGDRRSGSAPLMVANPNPTEQETGASVLQHRDGGRVRVPENDAEIPPSYDSIPADER